MNHLTRGALLWACLFTVAAAQQPTGGPVTPIEAYGVVDTMPPTPVDLWAAAHEQQPIRLAQSTDFSSRITPLPPTQSPMAGVPPPGSRSLFQGVDLSFDWAPRLDTDSAGRSTASVGVKFGFPTPVAPVMVTPRYGVHVLDGPAALDVPATFHDLELGFATFKRINDRWMARGIVNVGLYGDEHSLDDSDALRVTGFGMAIYEASPEWQWVLGVGYLNNQDFSVLPIFGLIHDRGWVRYELTMPRPRVVWTLPSGDACKRSVYLAGELGGGRWAVQRTAGPTAGATDVLQVSRFGVLLGYESESPTGSTWRYEIGYLFGRDLEYEATGEELSLDDSLIARVGWSF